MKAFNIHKKTPKPTDMKSTNSLSYTLLFSILLFSTSTIFAQFKLSGEIRPRTEYLHGFNSLADTSQDPAAWTEQRSRLIMDYASDNYIVRLVLQDVRTWGSTSQLNKSDNFSAVHEGWGKILFNKNFSLKMGRQEVMYDDHRIFGNVGWAQQARSHDMGLFQYKNDSNTTKIDIGVAFNQDKTQLTTNVYTVPKNYKTLQFLHFHKDLENKLGISVLLLNNGLQYSEVDINGNTDYSVNYSQTAGTYLSFKNKKVKASTFFYYQTGVDGTDRDINAFDAGAEIVYSVTENIGLGAGYELLSGTSQTDTANKENNSFAPFYGTNHKFNGFMDYFYVGNHANNVGLQDIYFKAIYKKKKFTAIVSPHLFSTAEDLLDTEELATTGEYKAMDAELGTEIDLTLKYKYSDDIAFQAGYSHMLATTSMEALKGGDKDEVNNWAYLMISFKPVFFTHQLNKK